MSWNEFWAQLKRTLGQRRPSVHVPIGLMRVNAAVTERLPGDIPLTRDLLKMLEHGDNIVTNDDAVRDVRPPARAARRAAAPSASRKNRGPPRRRPSEPVTSVELVEALPAGRYVTTGGAKSRAPYAG